MPSYGSNDGYGRQAFGSRPSIAFSSIGRAQASGDGMAGLLYGAAEPVCATRGSEPGAEAAFSARRQTEAAFLKAWKDVDGSPPRLHREASRREETGSLRRSQQQPLVQAAGAAVPMRTPRSNILAWQEGPTPRAPQQSRASIQRTNNRTPRSPRHQATAASSGRSTNILQWPESSPRSPRHRPPSRTVLGGMGSRV